MSMEVDNIEDIDAPDNGSNPNSPSKQSSSMQIDSPSNNERKEGTQKDQAPGTPSKRRRSQDSPNRQEGHSSSMGKKRCTVSSPNKENLKKVSDQQDVVISGSQTSSPMTSIVDRSPLKSIKDNEQSLNLSPEIPDPENNKTKSDQDVVMSGSQTSSLTTSIEDRSPLKSTKSCEQCLDLSPEIPDQENIEKRSTSKKRKPARESYNFTLIKPTLTGILDVELPQRKKATIPNSVSETDTPKNPEESVSPSRKSQSPSKKRVFRKELIPWPVVGTPFQIYGVYQLVDQGRFKKDKEGLQTALIIIMSYVKMNFDRLFPTVMEFERYEESSRKVYIPILAFDLEDERRRNLQEKREPYLQDFCSLLRCIRSDLQEFMQEAPTTDDLFDFLTRNLQILKERVVWYLTLKRRFSKVCEKCESFQEDIDNIEGTFNSWAQLFLLIILEISDFHRYYYPTE